MWIFEGTPVASRQFYEGEYGMLMNLCPEYNELYVPRDVYEGDPTPDLRPPKVFYVVYWFQLAEHRWLVGTCWGDFFDFWEAMLRHPETAAATQRATAESAPTFAALHSRKEAPFDHDVSLFQFADPDTNSTTWFLGAICGNVEIQDVNDFLEGRPGDTVRRVLSLSREVAVETKDGVVNLPNLLKYISSESTRRIWRNSIHDTAAATKFLSRFLGMTES